MSVVGRVDGLWRYPVKSMCGEELKEAFVGFSGIYGDRVFAFLSSAGSKGFPYLTAREQKEMLRYRPRFRDVKSAAQPVNLTEAMSIEPGVTCASQKPHPHRKRCFRHSGAGMRLTIPEPQLRSLRVTHSY